METFRENNLRCPRAKSVELGYSYSLVFQKGEQAWRVLRESLSGPQLPHKRFPKTDVPEGELVITNDQG